MQKRKGRATEIAHHLYAAGDAADPEETLNYLKQAINEGIEALAFEDTLAVIDKALEITADDKDIAQIAIWQLRALRGSNEIDAAETAVSQALETISDEQLQLTLRIEKINLLLDAYRSTNAMGDINSILESARGSGDTSQELAGQTMLTRALYQQSLDRPGAADEWGNANKLTIELARQQGDKIALTRALIDSAHQVDYWPNRHQEAHDNLTEAHQLALELKDKGLEIEARTLGLQVQVFTPKDIELEAEALRRKLIEIQDPLRLKEYLFWMMWQTYGLGKAGRCVEICTEGIELSERLGLPPVQYATIRGLAYIDLGRFGEARDSFDQEVSHGE
jgi:tetratricopeptide (TPR) repeat protein